LSSRQKQGNTLEGTRTREPIETWRIATRSDEDSMLRPKDSALELHADGSVRVVGQRLLMDVAALIKLLSAKVELP
jgi:hypothetical protein